MYEIYGVAKNENLKYKYNNWVTGPGENFYKDYSLVLVDSNRDTAYKFKTYIKAYSSSNGDVNKLSSEGNGFVSYIPKKYKKQNLKIAVLFKDRKNQMYLVYPEKEIQL